MLYGLEVQHMGLKEDGKL